MLQSQRQLQLSLEAHGRYISNLIEREGLHGKLENPQTRAALATLGMPPPPSAVASQEAGSSWHQEATPGVVPGLRGSPPLLPSGAPHDQQFLLGEENGDGPLPGLLLDTDLQAAAAVWDEGPKAGLLGPPLHHGLAHGGGSMLPQLQLPQPHFQHHLQQQFPDGSASSSMPGPGSASHFQGLDELQLPLLQPGALHHQDSLRSQPMMGHLPTQLDSLPPRLEGSQGQGQGQRHGRQTRPPVRLRD